MKILFDKYPIDIILCIIISFVLLPMSFLNIGGNLVIILGLIFILFIPGYLLISVLFPKKESEEGISDLNRVFFSFGISIAIVALIVFSLNYRTGKFHIETCFLPIFIYIIGMSILCLYRWYKIIPEERFIISIDLKFLKTNNKLDLSLIFILIALVIVTAAVFFYVATTPKTGEKFTDFYLLDSEGSIINYPSSINVSTNSSIIIGLKNHEYKTIDYTVEIWLINQTYFNNDSINENEIEYHNAWFMDKIEVTLDHQHSDTYGLWKPQWEYDYTVKTDKIGKDLNLRFLLFTSPVNDNYNQGIDLKDKIGQRINSAYDELYLWINVNQVI